MIGDEPDVEGEKDEILLVLLPNAVIDPGAVVVHLPDAPSNDNPLMPITSYSDL